MRIEEVPGVYGLKYEKYDLNDKKIQTVNVPIFKVNVDQLTYFIHLSEDGTRYESAYQYLNVKLISATYKKREQIATALKLLFSFMQLFNIEDLKDLTEEEVKKFVTFLRGGRLSSFNCSTIRSSKTINNYLTAYRGYLRYLKIDSPLLEKEVVVINAPSRDGFMAHVSAKKRERFNYRLKEAQQETAPMYINLKDYQTIQDLVEEEYSLREKVIFKLMYEYGMRIGEVLGLTLEDIIIDSEEEGAQLILRNRMSDKAWQHAKTTMKIYNKSDYFTSDYWSKDLGYEVVEISEECTELLCEYIEEGIMNPFISEKLRNNLLQKNIADKVTDRVDIENNHYIFISKNYTPIAMTSWNLIVRNIFKKVGIPVDVENRETNLNHKFRHGFAMYKVYFEGYDEMRLSKALRHSNSHTVLKYFNPSKEDKKQIVKQVEEFSLIQEVHLD